MSVVFDTSFVLPMVDKTAADKFEVPNFGLRYKEVLESLKSNHEHILIPTPVLSELLVRNPGSAAKYLERLSKTSKAKVVPFDKRAAVELAVIRAEAIKRNSKNWPTPEETKSKVSFDRQIVAIAKVWDAKRIYTHDQGLKAHGEAQGIEVMLASDLPLKNSHQTELSFETSSNAIE